MFQPSEKRTIKVFEELQERICFIGHTHTLEMMSFDGEAIETSDLPQGLTRLAKGKKYIINIGSVGQPRDDSSDAKYIIWDTTQDTIEVKFVPYEVAAVVQKIKAAGLPEEHADRLW
jgi:diadenosine tetraphosphatase ApaH/serine/threonine PP2A family protein phosphatase